MRRSLEDGRAAGCGEAGALVELKNAAESKKKRA